MRFQKRDDTKPSRAEKREEAVYPKREKFETFFNFQIFHTSDISIAVYGSEVD